MKLLLRGYYSTYMKDSYKKLYGAKTGDLAAHTISYRLINLAGSEITWFSIARLEWHSGEEPHLTETLIILL